MKLLMLLKSPLDYDSRVKKEIASLVSAGYKVSLVSVNGIVDSTLESHVVLYYEAKRRFIPGVSFLFSHFTFFRAALSAYNCHDFVHCHDLNTLLAGVLLKVIKRRKIKLVYDSHEYAPNDVPNEGKLSIAIKYLFEKALINFADSVIVVSEGIARKYGELYNPKILSTVMNCPARTEVQRTNYFHGQFELPPDSKIFLYQGGLSHGRGIEIIIQAFDEIEISEANLVVMGSGSLEDAVKEAAKRCKRIHYHLPVPSKKLLNYTAAADYGILFYEDTCLNHSYCSPNKMFEYLMAGLPVLTSNLDEMKRLVESKGVGIVAEDNTVNAFKMAVKKMMMTDKIKYENSINLARNIYSWENQEYILIDTYRKLRNS